MITSQVTKTVLESYGIDGYGVLRGENDLARSLFDPFFLTFYAGSGPQGQRHKGVHGQPAAEARGGHLQVPQVL